MKMYIVVYFFPDTLYIAGVQPLHRWEQELSKYPQGTPGALPAATLPLSGLGTGTEYAGLHTPRLYKTHINGKPLFGRF